MVEILDNISILKDRNVAISQLKLLDIALGDSAQKIPREKINKKSTLMNNRGEKFESIIKLIMATSGLVCVNNQLSFVISDSIVIAFSIGDNTVLSPLKSTSYEQFLLEFGLPDKVEENVQCEELIGYAFYFLKQKMRIYWRRSGTVASVIIGDYKMITKHLNVTK